jgi:hypothetical protein
MLASRHRNVLQLVKKSICLSCSVAAIEHQDQKHLGKERVDLSLHSQVKASLLREVRAGIKAGQEPGGRNSYRGHGRVMLTDFLSKACSACFIIAPKTIIPEMAMSTLSWAIPQQLLI